MEFIRLDATYFNKASELVLDLGEHKRKVSIVPKISLGNRPVNLKKCYKF